LLNAAETAVDSDPFDDTFQCYAASITKQKYEYVDTDQVAENQKHLTPEQCSQLANVLNRFQQLFSGNLGCYPQCKLRLDLLPDATPVRKRPYTVVHAHQEVFKRNLDCLCSLGVLERTGASEWGAPTFIIPKKDGRVRWVSDFRELNKLIKRKVNPLLNIMDILRKRSDYQYFTKLHISMQYYSFELDEESKDLCTIVTPYGNYRYNRLPMGVKQSPDFAQEIMEDVLHDIDDADVYIDDIGAFSPTWEAHLKLLSEILQRLQENNFTVNPLKCEWAVKETDWLGYWLTPTGLKPWKKKIEAILRLERPINISELRSFIGMVTFYWNVR
jgi:Reverse transcriptase (RNA-dependent DNA polymerase)